MPKLRGILLAACFGLLSAGPGMAAPLNGDVTLQAAPQSLIENIQYGRGRHCEQLRRQCDRGDGGCRRYREECGGGGGYYQPQVDRCGNWRRECAKLYGWQTRVWYQCMGQPGAIRDCAGR